MRLAPHIPIAAAAAILTLQLFIPPIVGLANNGDFGKVLAPFSIGPSEADEYKFAPVRYTFDPAHQIWTGYYSSAQILAALAVDLNAILSPHNAFDLRFIGLIHSAALLIAFYFAPRRLWIGLVTVFVFTDVMYASQLNSFYMATASFVFLMLAVTAYLRAWGALFVCASLLLVTSKAQHALLGLLIVALLIVDRDRLGLRGRSLAASITAVLFAVWFAFASAPSGYSAETRFDAIFFRLIPRSAEPAADLRDLGLDESWLKYSGTFAHAPNSPLADKAKREEFVSRTSYLGVAGYYLRRPSYVVRDIVHSLGEAGRQRPELGNFDRKYGFREFAESQSFAWWSNLKRRVFEGRGALNLAYFCALAAAAMWLARRDPMRYGIGALILGGFLTMSIAALADSLDMPRHFFLYHAIEDSMLVMCVARFFEPRTEPLTE